MKKVEPWIQTFTGKKFDFENPKQDMICIEDIAHSLAMQCRYAGHTKRHYSVAQHSIIVSDIVPEELALAGLLHDANEAYVQDLTKPYKDLIHTNKIGAITSMIDHAICSKFGINYHDLHSPVIKEADLIVLKSEALQVLANKPIENWHKDLPGQHIVISEWTWEVAEKMFLEWFYGLDGLRDKNNS